MPNSNTYTVAGISFYRGAYRLRTSNNLAERTKTLQAMGDDEINLIELPRPMTKTEIVVYLTGHLDFDSEHEQELLARLRARWLSPTNKGPATGVSKPAAVAPTAAQATPNWEPDF